MGRNKETESRNSESSCSSSSSSSSSPSSTSSSSSDSSKATSAKNRTSSASSVSSAASPEATVSSPVSHAPSASPASPLKQGSLQLSTVPPANEPSPPSEVASSPSTTINVPVKDSASCSQSLNSSSATLPAPLPPSTPSLVGDAESLHLALEDEAGKSLLHDSRYDQTHLEKNSDFVSNTEKCCAPNSVPVSDTAKKSAPYSERVYNAEKSSLPHSGPGFNAEKINVPYTHIENGPDLIECEQKERQAPEVDMQKMFLASANSVDDSSYLIEGEPKQENGCSILYQHAIDHSLNDGTTTMDLTKPAVGNGPSNSDLAFQLSRNQQHGNATAEDIIEDGLDYSLSTDSILLGFEYGSKLEDDIAMLKQAGELLKQESELSADTKTHSLHVLDTKDKVINEDEAKLQATNSAPSAVLRDQLWFQSSLNKPSHHPSPALQLPHEDSRDKANGVGQLTPERAFWRSTTLPSKSFSNVYGKASEPISRQLPRSNTEKGKSRKNYESTNVRIVTAEKRLHRKKEKLMRNLGIIKKDGTVEVNLDERAHLGPDLFASELCEPFDDTYEEECTDKTSVPPLQIVMLIVGTRGDVQPFIAIGKHLQEYGHRVRLATHANFREFVMSSGLEFYPLGGDPKVLAGYMVKNKGFLPSGPFEISIQRKQLKAIINSLLPACIEPDDESRVPFRAQAIIANPPAYGHVHVQEALGVPLHIFFTMPWTPTSEFPHPLARIKNPAGFRISYQVVDSLIWLGIKSLINDFRKKKLRLRPITYLSGSQGSIANLPTGYIWSPHLVPKPKDWGPRTDVVGFCFLNLATEYKPPEDLVNWLQAGSKPIYIGFGSLPIEDPKRMMDIIIKALEKTQQRGIIVKGWGFTSDVRDLPDFVYLLENCPHDWLFPRCAAVVHHGGAGTTAAGLKAACPTTIVPFFGDQPFWGDRVHLRGVGPLPIPVEHFSLDKLVAAIQFMLDPQVKERANELAKAMEGEDGVVGAVNAFHKHLPTHMPACRTLKTSRQRRLSQIMRRMWCTG